MKATKLVLLAVMVLVAAIWANAAHACAKDGMADGGGAASAPASAPAASSFSTPRSIASVPTGSANQFIPGSQSTGGGNRGGGGGRGAAPSNMDSGFNPRVGEPIDYSKPYSTAF